MTTHSGSCQCGGVSFTLTDPGPGIACHCGKCRKTTGAAFIVATTVPGDSGAITLADGVTLDEFASSEYLTRRRCSRCGATVLNAVKLKGRAFDNYMVTLLDDPSAIELSHHIYYADRVVDVSDDRPKFDAWGRPG